MPHRPLLSPQERLDVLACKIAQSSCPLRATATRAVPGEGSASARIFFIGEAPGKQEDATGRPFVGAAGKMLTHLLESIGLQREEVFITSIEKFRPPANRPPRHEEIDACFPYLEEQIEIISPDIIVPMGLHALRWILTWERGERVKGALSMEDFHGKVFHGKKGYIYFPVHHPAAILYNRKLLPLVEREFAMIPSLLCERTHGNGHESDAKKYRKRKEKPSCGASPKAE